MDQRVPWRIYVTLGFSPWTNPAPVNTTGALNRKMIASVAFKLAIELVTFCYRAGCEHIGRDLAD